MLTKRLKTLYMKYRVNNLAKDQYYKKILKMISVKFNDVQPEGLKKRPFPLKSMKKSLVKFKIVYSVKLTKFVINVTGVISSTVKDAAYTEWKNWQ